MTDDPLGAILLGILLFLGVQAILKFKEWLEGKL